MDSPRPYASSLADDQTSRSVIWTKCVSTLRSCRLARS